MKLIDGSPSEILSDLNRKFGESGLMLGIVDTVDYKKEWSSDLDPKILTVCIHMIMNASLAFFFLFQFLRRNRPPVEITQPPSLDMYTVLLKTRRRLLHELGSEKRYRDRGTSFDQIFVFFKLNQKSRRIFSLSLQWTSTRRPRPATASCQRASVSFASKRRAIRRTRTRW